MSLLASLAVISLSLYALQVSYNTNWLALVQLLRLAAYNFSLRHNDLLIFFIRMKFTVSTKFTGQQHHRMYRTTPNDLVMIPCRNNSVQLNWHVASWYFTFGFITKGYLFPAFIPSNYRPTHKYRATTKAIAFLPMEIDEKISPPATSSV